MNALDRIAAVLHRARVDGGWSDEDVAHLVLRTLGLNSSGHPVQPEPPTIDQAPTSSNLGHG